MSALYDQGFCTRVPSWHRLENVVFDEYPGREVAFMAAGHDFTLVETMAGDEGGLVDPQTYTGPMVRVRNEDTNLIEWRSYRRSTREKGLRLSQLRDGAPGPLHGKSIKMVNKSYEPIQNTVPWDILDTILSDESINKGLRLNYETGGVLEGGASCFVTAYLDHPFMIDGDDSKVYPYLFANWRHDGAGALNVGGTSVREVCANTVAAAEGEAARMGRLFTFKHTRNVADRIKDAKMALKGIMIEHSEFQALAESLAKIELTETQRKEFVETFIPYPSSALDASMQVSDRVARNIEEARAAVYGALRSKSIPEAHRFTGWGAFNAATEYLDHLRPGRGGSPVEANLTSYVNRTLLKPNAAKNVIIPLIREVAKVAA
jgi:phage/plasmid-like protein (TIGR03299 family)